ncbi:MAG: hydantoinase/oxoprolinase family protein [Betaproteobacteria bacterium]|nr:hydantoinase/oxoprolinase family protein [Betaproteobacteria bacterium]
MPAATYRIGVDIGGTFTDIVLLSSNGAIHTHKTLTTPDDFGRGIAAGIVRVLETVGAKAAAIERVIHGTTVATNAILEHKGARTALVTTRGFRDVLEMRRLRIPEMYTLNYAPSPPLVPRRLRLEVTERMGPDGKVRVALDEASVHAAAERLAAEEESIAAVAISLLHSYANPDHERRIAAILAERLGKDVFISCSYDILPVIREYERTSTTVINAFLGPTLRAYFASLERHLGGIGVQAPIHVMKSDGGVMTLAAAALRPACIVESGPAAGVIGAAAGGLSRDAADRTPDSTPDIITFDMGGTTAKVSLVEQGRITHTGDYEVGAGINLSSKLVMGGGYALKLPVIDISEVGAGGGSLVSIDAGSLLRVGPQSAGAMPGPVCYDQGGTQATFTDAALALGFLNPDAIAGGGLRLNAAKALVAMREQVAAPLAKDIAEAAYGVLQVACSTMVRAVKAVSTYRGRDPRDFTLYAFGGNGPLAAAQIADLLEMKRVMVPPNPGVFSAYGLLCARVEHDIARAWLTRLGDTTPRAMAGLYASLEAELLARMSAEGHARAQLEVLRYADLRYAGQAHEITIPVDCAVVPVVPGNAGNADNAGNAGEPDFKRLAKAFGDEHERTYGHQAESEQVECVTLRVVARVIRDEPMPAPVAAINARAGVPAGSARLAYFGERHGQVNTPVIGRADLASAPRAGPLIIEEYDATCVVPPDWSAALDGRGNIVLARE